MDTNYNTLFNSMVNRDSSLNDILNIINQNHTTTIEKLNTTDLSINETITKMNTNYDTIIDRVIDIDNNMESNYNSIINKLIENDNSYNVITEQLVLSIEKISKVDASMNNLNSNIVSVIDKISNTDISMNSLTQNIVQTINKLTDVVSQVDTNYTNVFSGYIPSLTAALDSLTSSNTNSSTALQTLLSTIDDNTHATQRTITEYIGKYVVIPLFEQRVNDITAQNYGDLENIVLVHLNAALYKFRAGDFEGLKTIFNKQVEDEYTINIHNLKTAFIRYMSTTPGGNTISDLNVHARSHYKTFKKYIMNIYRSLDGLEKAISLYEEFKNLEGINELNKIKADILEDPDKLKEYIANLNKQQNTPALFDVTGSSTATPT